MVYIYLSKHIKTHDLFFTTLSLVSWIVIFLSLKYHVFIVIPDPSSINNRRCPSSIIKSLWDTKDWPESS